MNTVIISGNLTTDPVLKSTQNGKEMCTLRVAVNSGWGENQQTAFLHVITFGKTAANCDRFLAKGRKVLIRGRITTGSYEKQNGEKVYTTDIIADDVEFLGKADNDAPKKEQTTEEVAEEIGFQKITDMDLPF